MINLGLCLGLRQGSDYELNLVYPEKKNPWTGLIQSTQETATNAFKMISNRRHSYRIVKDN